MFDHVGMLCRHSIKVLIRDDVLRLPSKNIMKRWTIWAAGEYPKGMDMNDKNSPKHDIGYLKNLLRIAVEDLVKESTSKDTIEQALAAVTKTTAAIRKKNRATKDKQERLPENAECPVNITCSEMLPPMRVPSSGRPATVRPKSRMDHVADKKKKKRKASSNNGSPSTAPRKKKSRPVASLYDADNMDGTPAADGDEDTVSPEIVKPKRKIHCQSCNEPGHTRLKCTRRGISQNLFGFLEAK